MVLGLDAMRALLSSLPPSLYSPSACPPSVHVAGSNGKGSVVHKVAAALRAQGLSVGVFCSPHLSTFRERISVDGEPMSEEEVVRLVPDLLTAAAASHAQPTFFELCTALALVHFHLRRVDVSVVEVGLGGRLDSTNVISPRLSIITSIGLEHVDVLGSTFSDICREKCGIIKSHTPVVVGPTVPLEVAQPIASSLQAELLAVAPSPYASFDEENAAIALRAISVLQADAAVQAALRRRGRQWDAAAAERALTTRPPCRYEQLQLSSPLAAPPLSSAVSAVLDVAHNPPAFARLMSQLRADYPGRCIRAVFGMSADKDIDGCLAQLLPHSHEIHLVQAHNSPRSASIEQLQRAAHRVRSHLDSTVPVAQVRVDAGGDVERSVALALQLSAEQGDVLLVCGSFFIFRHARPGLGLHCPTDPLDLNESSLKPPTATQSSDVIRHTSAPGSSSSSGHSAANSAPAAAVTASATTLRSGAGSLMPARASPPWSSLPSLPLRALDSTSGALPSSSPLAQSSAPRHLSSSASSIHSTPSPASPPSPVADVSSAVGHRARVLRLYREMLHLATHLRSPLTVTPRQDVQRAFRERAQMRASGEEVEAAIVEAQSRVAYMRANTPAWHHRKGAATALTSPTPPAHHQQSGASLASSALSDAPARSPSSVPSAASSPPTSTSSSDAAWQAGYQRIFGDAGRSSSGGLAEAAEERQVEGAGDGVRRFRYDEFGELVVPISEEEREVEVELRGLKRRVSNHQGITDEQRRRNQQLMDRFHFKGPFWKGR